MRKKNHSFLKGLIGVLLLGIVGGGIFYWESYGRESLIYKEVVVFIQSIPKNTIIDATMLGSIRIEEKHIIENAILDPSKIIGLESKNFIPQGAILSPEYFGESTLVLGSDERIFKIPQEWIKSFPQTLRRGDQAYIYPVEIIEETTVSKVSSNTDTDTTTDIIEDVIYSKKSDEPIAVVTIAFVKDSANREVIDVEGTDRINSSSSIASIEVIATVEVVNQIISEVQKGLSLILLYD